MNDRPDLPGEALRRRCDPAGFSFATTEELKDVPGIIGQERAEEAVRFAIGIRRYGYNLFALGPTGMGKHGFVRALLDRRATQEPAPPDRVYVHGFEDARRPRVLDVPAGTAPALRDDLARVLRELQAAIPAVFEGEDYRARRRQLETRFSQASERPFAEVEKRARERDVSMVRTAQGIGFAPLRGGEVMSPEEFQQLPEADRERFKAAMAELQKEVEEAASALPTAARLHREEVRKLDRLVTARAAGQLVDELRARWAEVPAVLEYLGDVERDVVDNSDDFLPPPEGASAVKALLGSRGAAGRGFRRYEVNVLVTRKEKGAPVVYEDNPSPTNLVGRIENVAELGNLVTDHTLIQAGALHRANGGYLIVDARRILAQPLAWDELKRALRSRQVRVDSVVRTLSLVASSSLEPEPVPLDVKVVLVGERRLYYLLSALDPEFEELFKIAADFDEHVDRTPEGEACFARLLATFARRESLRPLDREAVALAVEHAARRAGDSAKLLVHAESIADLLREADHLAGEAGAGTVGAAHVRAAIDAHVRRSSRIEERMREDVLRGTVLIDIAGEVVGQVNALSVVQLGDYAFGRPSRITARVRLGSGSVVDIEKEVALGGALHSKGVLILAGFLGQRFASDKPLSLGASLVFEQSYSGVDGDSASCAELVALLSALADAPVRQGRAITGSVNQHGQVQAIGGVNEKIEGFFDVCRRAGLTGSEGVLIPASNVKHLMLRPDVVGAAAEGLFHVWPVETVDQAIELLTGRPSGERGPDGRFPEGSVNRAVDDRLTAFAEKARAFGRTPPAVGAAAAKGDKAAEEKPREG